MNLLTTLKAKATQWLIGELLVDLGPLVADEQGRRLSLSIRQRAGKQPHLLLKWKGDGETGYQEIFCTREWAAQFERVAQEMRRHCGE